MKIFIRNAGAALVSGAVFLAFLGTSPAPAEIVVQLYPTIQHLPAHQILSESGLGMTRWLQSVQQLPSPPAGATPPGQRARPVPRRQLKIAYVYVAAPTESHTAGLGKASQSGAITAESQSDATRHEMWHIEVARAAAAKANELEANLIALLPTRTAQSEPAWANEQSALMRQIEQAVTLRYQALKDRYNRKLHAVSSATVVQGIWRDNQDPGITGAVDALLAQLRAEPAEETEPRIADASPRT